MIVVDIETSGLDYSKCGIWQIAAMEFEAPENVFFEEAKIDEDDIIETKALDITGKNEEELREKNKQSQKELLNNFLRWINKIKIKNFICQNPQFDLAFLISKTRKYKFPSGLEFSIPHRAFDLHSIASFKYYQINGKFLIEDNKSKMNLGNTLKFCGLVDNRKHHNALEDVKLTAECFSRIVYGKNLFMEFDNYPIPEYLK